MPPNWRFANCSWPVGNDMVIVGPWSSPFFRITDLTAAMQRCADLGDGCDGISVRQNWKTTAQHGQYEWEGHRKVDDPNGPFGFQVRNCTYPYVPRRWAYRGGWSNPYKCRTYFKICLPPSPAGTPPSPPVPLLPPGELYSPPPSSPPPAFPSNNGTRTDFGLPGCADASRCCTVIFEGAPGAYCAPVPVWDLANWRHPGGPAIQVSSLCGITHYNWLLLSPRHPVLSASRTAMPHSGQSLYGGGFRVGTYIDPECHGMQHQPPPPPPYARPPVVPGGAALPFGISACASRCCVVIYQGAPGEQCNAVPVWDLSNWNHPGGPFVMAAPSRCGRVLYNWLSRSPSHQSYIASDELANPETGPSLVGGGMQVGSYIDPYLCVPPSAPLPPSPPPSPPPPPGTMMDDMMPPPLPPGASNVRTPPYRQASRPVGSVQGSGDSSQTGGGGGVAAGIIVPLLLLLAAGGAFYWMKKRRLKAPSLMFKSTMPDIAVSSSSAEGGAAGGAPKERGSIGVELSVELSADHKVPLPPSMPHPESSSEIGNVRKV